ncbi:phospholipid/glycerol acyltransferase [Thiobacillus denitrificans ATCC 25259]|uniref:Phospholipid/glycerol acyltransferase n=1 Tax=Thiobacillus denitrificans (strain ATCC 25259 / T1) TaxID=292415 RepID=Q3SMC5_THIDA|nr:lysophospholipid acyltransferase family protein [Thiobacillus denitrificans]AAZ96122.1 phospholipid/glycerol acyltransferase [Thiobacillus denitrificans ATCC 25259]
MTEAPATESLRVTVRRSYRILRLLLHVLWGVALAGAVFPLLGSRQRDALIVGWSRRLLAVLGVELRAGAVPHLSGGALLVCNHVSWLDIYLIYAARRVHFVSKAEVRKWPIAGWLAHKSGTLFLERSRRADTARVNGEMRALMTSGAWVAVFPEGTTSDGRGLRRFLPSLLQPAVELNCPIVPAALRYRTLHGEQSTAPAYIDGVGMWQSLRQIASEPGLVAELQFGEPIAPDGHRRELAAQAERAVADLLGVSPSATAPDGTSPRTPADPRA